MQILHPIVAGVDVHQKMLAITVLKGPADAEPEVIQMECATFTDDLIACGMKLLELGVKEVAMESSGIYWKPVYHAWSPLGLKITLGNAAHIKNVPGRKTDLKDSHWIASLHRCGLIPASYIPEREYQEMRALNRHRQNLVCDASQVKNRIIKVLEDANLKLSSVISDVFGVSGLAILRKIAEGITNKHLLAKEVTTKIKRKEDIPRALSNTLTRYQVFLIKQLLTQFDGLQDLVTEVEAELKEKTQAHQELIEKLVEVPGIDETLAQGILAEATAKMDSFKDDKAFAAWAGVAPGNNESGGKKKEQGQGREIPL